MSFSLLPFSLLPPPFSLSILSFSFCPPLSPLSLSVFPLHPIILDTKTNNSYQWLREGCNTYDWQNRFLLGKGVSFHAVIYSANGEWKIKDFLMHILIYHQMNLCIKRCFRFIYIKTIAVFDRDYIFWHPSKCKPCIFLHLTFLFLDS